MLDHKLILEERSIGTDNSTYPQPYGRIRCRESPSIKLQSGPEKVSSTRSWERAKAQEYINRGTYVSPNGSPLQAVTRTAPSHKGNLNGIDLR